MNIFYSSLRRHSTRAMQSTTRFRQVRPISQLEVERKFIPSPNFRELVGTLVKTSSEAPASGTTWTQQKTVSIRDTYFDLNDQLSEKGVWIRYRTVRVPNAHPTVVSNGWDAKVRVGGDYIDSEFMELEGENEMRTLLCKHLPDTRLEDLDVLVDLETLRSSWTIDQREQDGNRSDHRINLVLDYIRSTEQDFYVDGRLCQFRHCVGEIEVTKPLHSSSASSYQSAKGPTELKHMRAEVQEFMDNHKDLFAAERPVGKLSAYFEWKQKFLEQG